MREAQALAALADLANETRLQIVRLLVPHGRDGLPEGEIGGKVDCSASRLSFHLSALEQAGLIVARRDGRRVIYSARRRKMGSLIGYLLNDCCNGDETVCNTCGFDGPNGRGDCRAGIHG
jgi:DNA-binding transcriptional ArsR family regulator